MFRGLKLKKIYIYIYIKYHLIFMYLKTEYKTLYNLIFFVNHFRRGGLEKVDNRRAEKTRS